MSDRIEYSLYYKQHIKANNQRYNNLNKIVLAFDFLNETYATYVPRYNAIPQTILCVEMSW